MSKPKLHYPIRPVHIKHKHYWLEAVVIIAVLLLVGYIDNQVALAKERENVIEAEQRANNCFNGLGKWVFEDGSEAGCYEAETN